MPVLDIEDLALVASHNSNVDPNYLIFNTLDKFLDEVKSNNLLGRYEIVNGGLNSKPTPGGNLWTKSSQKPFVDISQIEELKKIELDGNNVTIGGAVKIAALIEFMTTMKASHVTRAIIDYLNLGAGPGIRNLGSVVGNLLTAQNFASDIYPLFLISDIFKYKVATTNGDVKEICGGCSIPKGYLVINVTFRIPDESSVLLLRKIANRSSMTLAIATCCFVKKKWEKNGKIVFGGKNMKDYCTIQAVNFENVN